MTTTAHLSVIEAELFIRAAPERIAAVLADPAFQARWARGLTVRPYADRGAEGLRAVVSGVLTGSCEWWIEPLPAAAPAGPDQGRGAVVHFWLRPVEPESWWTAGPAPRRRADLHRRRLARDWRAALFRLKDELEQPHPDGTGFPGHSRDFG